MMSDNETDFNGIVSYVPCWLRHYTLPDNTPSREDTNRIIVIQALDSAYILFYATISSSYKFIYTGEPSRIRITTGTIIQYNSPR